MHYCVSIDVWPLTQFKALLQALVVSIVPWVSVNEITIQYPCLRQPTNVHVDLSCMAVREKKRGNGEQGWEGGREGGWEGGWEGGRAGGWEGRREGRSKRKGCAVIHNQEFITIQCICILLDRS